MRPDITLTSPLCSVSDAHLHGHKRPELFYIAHGLPFLHLVTLRHACSTVSLGCFYLFVHHQAIMNGPAHEAGVACPVWLTTSTTGDLPICFPFT